MAARHWTPEQRTKQAALIHHWQPWQHSTGARTLEGKAISSRNAFRPTQRKFNLLAGWLCKQMRLIRSGKPYATQEEAERRANLSWGLNAAPYRSPRKEN